MLGHKIFVLVQTFWRRPFVHSHNFCHPVQWWCTYHKDVTIELFVKKRSPVECDWKERVQLQSRPQPISNEGVLISQNWGSIVSMYSYILCMVRRQNVPTTKCPTALCTSQATWYPNLCTLPGDILSHFLNFDPHTLGKAWAYLGHILDISWAIALSLAYI